MRLSGQFQACLLFIFLRNDLERIKSTNNFHSLRSSYLLLYLLLFVCLFLFLWVGFGWFAFLYAQNLFVKNKINLLQIVLIASFYSTTCPFNQPQTPKRLMKPVVDDLTIHSISCQNTFPKEKERFQNFSKSVKRFEEIDNVLADISSKHHHSHSQVWDSKWVVELFKTRLSTWEKQLIEKKCNHRFSFKEKNKNFETSNSTARKDHV